MRKRKNTLKKTMAGAITTTLLLQSISLDAFASESQNSINEIPNIEHKSEIKNLAIGNKQIINIPDINFKKILNKQLNQPENSDITKSQLESITTLISENSKITSIKGIEYCTNLTFLNLNNNNIEDISYLKNLKKLKNLRLNKNNISDISPLKNLINLENLDLGINKITNITPISNLSKLTILELGINQVSDLTPISNLKNLKTLRAMNNKIDDITPISNLTNLTFLNLDNNNISKLTNISSLVNLTTLKLGGNKITDITPISKLINLTNLDLKKNNIINIKNLSPLSKLVNLNISNQIYTLESKKVLCGDNLSINNPVIDTNGIVTNINQISDNGKYNNNQNSIEWTNLDANKDLTFLFNKNVNIGKATGVFSGTVTQPIILNYSVTYDSQGGSNVPQENVEYNGLVTKPSDPTREGYTFGGWYTDNTLKTEWNFDKDKMPSKNMTLYAKWNINSYNVTYDSQGGSNVPQENVEYNGLVTKPSDPTREGYTFGGWYTDNTLKTEWNFDKDKMPSKNMTLYAKWNINSYNVTYDSQGGSSVPQENVEYNGLVTKPSDPTKEGYTFGGWYTDDTFKTEWNFDKDKMPSKNMTLYAKWLLKWAEINNAPVITAENKTIKVGDKFDPMTGVAATDAEDGNITKDIKVIENTVNTNKPGTYKVVYEITDSQGAKTIKEIHVTVVSNDKPIINGANNVIIVEGTSFDPMAGVTATDTEDGNITKDIKVTGTVNTNKPGKYELTYTVTDSDGNTTIVKRIVTVNMKWAEINNAPVITAENKTIKVGDKFDPMTGVAATDAEDGNITKDIKVIENTVNTNKPGTYKVVYEITDSQGAKTIKEIHVTVVSNDKPIINGANNVIIVEGTSFDPMAGVTATDTEDGNITKDIKVTGTVNTNKPGKYELTYTVTDSDGNTTIVKRIVTVNMKWAEINNAPVITAENKTIKVGDKFDPMTGVAATDAEDGNITKDIKVIENTVNTNKPGTYKVVYEITDSQGAKTIKEIHVTVVSNDKPIINGANNVIIVEGTSFDPMAGVTATDTEDGNITKDIKVTGTVNTNKPGKYELTYTVTDSDGNTTIVKRIVTVNMKWAEINNAPVITAENKTIKVGDKFDPMTGVAATDAEDGNITKDIKVIENTVNTNKPGTYKVVYEITDSQGIKTKKTITVTVVNKNKPVINESNDTTNNNKPITNESTSASNDKVTLPATGATSSLPLIGSILVGLGGLFASKKKNNKE
ncbi:immunoglobulin-like domain-containing protein [Clostridium baratii]|uniref:immunoglobulin-like domain-containing protein n=1 Tax=Clostridium baratii TaxID=1561 RepID=UPI0030CF9D67